MHDREKPEDLQNDINAYLMHHAPKHSTTSQILCQSDIKDPEASFKHTNANECCYALNNVAAQELKESQSSARESIMSADSLEEPLTPRRELMNTHFVNNDFLDPVKMQPELVRPTVSGRPSSILQSSALPKPQRSGSCSSSTGDHSSTADSVTSRRVPQSSLLNSPRNRPSYTAQTVSRGLKAHGTKGEAVARLVASTAAGAAAAATASGESTKKALGFGSAPRSSSARRAKDLPPELKLAPAASLAPPKLRADDLKGPALNGAFNLTSGVTETRCVAAQNKRREERQQKLAAYLEEREMGQCTFTPKITSKAKAQKKVDTEVQAKRLTQQKMNWELRQEELRQEKLRKELEECSFTPNMVAAKACKGKAAKPPSCLVADQMVSKFVERQQKGREAREIARKATCLRPEEEDLHVAAAGSGARKGNLIHCENSASSGYCTPGEPASCPPRAACSLAMQEAANSFVMQGQPSNLRSVLQDELRSLVL